MGDERIGSYFWMSEFLRSEIATRKGLDNTPGPAESTAIREILAPGMERVRNLLGVPVFISSGFRSKAVNEAVGGAVASQHLFGQAADFIAPQAGTPRAIAQRIAQHWNDVRFDQLIWEGSWVHISFTQAKPRAQVLTARFGPGGVVYTPGIA